MPLLQIRLPLASSVQPSPPANLTQQGVPGCLVHNVCYLHYLHAPREQCDVLHVKAITMLPWITVCRSGAQAHTAESMPAIHMWAT